MQGGEVGDPEVKLSAPEWPLALCNTSRCKQHPKAPSRRERWAGGPPSRHTGYRNGISPALDVEELGKSEGPLYFTRIQGTFDNISLTVKGIS